MERRKAITTAAAASLTLLAGAGGIALNSGIVGAGADNNVGQISPVAEPPITVYVDDPATAPVVLVVVAVTLAVETKSLLLGESAAPEAQDRIRAALDATPVFERIIHLKTLHLGPEELLVAAKVGVAAGTTVEQLAEAIDTAEAAVRAAEPTAQVIYLEPDLYRADYVPAERPEPPAPAGH